MCNSESRLYEDYATNRELKFPSKFVDSSNLKIPTKKCASRRGELLVHQHTACTVICASVLGYQTSQEMIRPMKKLASLVER